MDAGTKTEQVKLLEGCRHFRCIMQPSDMEAEEAVLGSLLIDPEAIEKVVDWLGPDDFHREAHGLIYTAMLSLYYEDKAIDIVTVSAELKRRDRLREVGGPARLAQLITRTPTAIHVAHYARVVSECSARRQLERGASEIAKLAHHGEYDSLLHEAEAVVQRALNGRIKDSLILSPNEWADLMLEHLPSLREQKNLLPWSTKTLNNIMPDLMPGTLTVIGARTGHGKSFLMLHEGIVHASQGRPVLLATAENTVFQTLIRALSNTVQVNSAKLFKGQWEDEIDDYVTAGVEEMRKWPLYLVGHAGVKRSGQKRSDRPSFVRPSEIRRGAVRMESEGFSPDLIVADYVQAIWPDSQTGNIRTNIIDVLWSLKNTGLEFACPVLTGAQVGRQVDHRNKMPQLTDLKESGAIEEVADGVAFLVNWSQYYAPGEVIRESKEGRRCSPNEWMLYAGKDRWDGLNLSAAWVQVALEYAHIGDLATQYEQGIEASFGRYTAWD